MSISNANLSGADLTLADLRGADLSKTNLRTANLNKSNLQGANLYGADLREADLKYADLSNADLLIANFMKANLEGAKLKRAYLWQTNFNEAYLFRADLSEADLRSTLFNRANLIKANFTAANLNDVFLKDTKLSSATFSNTVLANIDLSLIKEINKVNHSSPSSISTKTIQLSKGKIPEAFLRGCGLSDLDIEYAKLYNPDLSDQEIDEILYKIHDLRAHQSIQISPLFISYSHVDSKFVDKVEIQLDQRGVRFWRDVHHATAGPLEKQIDRAIQLNSTVLLILSENSIGSDWVQHEVRFARELEKETKRHVLCPVALDESWKSSPWPKRVMEQVMEYNILDFSEWEDKSIFEKQYRKLLDGLDLFYK